MSEDMDFIVSRSGYHNSRERIHEETISIGSRVPDRDKLRQRYGFPPGQDRLRVRYGPDWEVLPECLEDFRAMERVGLLR